MALDKLSQSEANKLISMLKHTLVSEIKFPEKGCDTEFKVEGDTNRDIFVLNIFRGKCNHLKYNIGARISKNGIMLLELHIGPTNVHINPDGEKITGNHWHIYKEGEEKLWAVVAEELENDQFVENTILFLKKFNVIEQPIVNCQLELL